MEMDLDALKRARNAVGSDNVLRAEPGMNALIKSSAFSMILMPSYDSELQNMLRWARVKLVRGGYLINLVHKKQLNEFLSEALWAFDVVKALSWRRDFHVLMLKRRDRASKPRKEDISEAIHKVNGRLFLDMGVCRVPAAPELRIKPFKSLVRSAEELYEMLDHSTLRQEALAALARARTAREEVPPLPLKQGHIALQLATGRFNGVVGTGENRHVVKGRVVRTPFERTEMDDEGFEMTVTEDLLSVEVTALTRGGTVQRFSSEGEEAH